MQSPAPSGSPEFIPKRRFRHWRKFLVILACLAVFCTTYALILPALTLERTCSLPEHTHTEDCYSQVTTIEKATLICTAQTLNVHQHTATCYGEDGEILCGYADFLLHTHDDACYQDNTLCCTLPEILPHLHTQTCYAADTEDTGAEQTHTHTPSCYGKARGNCICTLQETDGHIHDEGCFDENGNSCCELTNSVPHQHNDDCYEWSNVLLCEEENAESVLICRQPELVAHTHTEECFTTDGTLICGKLELHTHQHIATCFSVVNEAADTQTLTCTNTDPEHTHTARCYGVWQVTCGMQMHLHSSDCQSLAFICGLDEHTHSETCFDERGAMVCLKDVHTHTAACLPVTYICGFEEHSHVGECYDESGTPICGKTEHTHVETCKKFTLTEAEQAQVDTVDAQITDLPSLEDLQTMIQEWEAANSGAESQADSISVLSLEPRASAVDSSELEEQLVSIYRQYSAARTAYDALSPMQQSAVQGREKLLAIGELFSVTQIPNIEQLTSDRAYVTDLKVRQLDTGTAPFDADDAPGNDSSSTNAVVRTFDTLSYSFSVSYASYLDTDIFNEARVKIEFVLPVSADEAEFDQTSMGWMEDPVLTTDERGQVLTCYKPLFPSADHTSVVPGEFSENLDIRVKMMNNGDVLTPTVSAAMEYNTWDGVCSKHDREEKITVQAQPITISAAPKYNVQIQKAFASELSQDFDFSASSPSMRNTAYALNQDAGTRPGRIYTFGVTLQLYNDSASKGLRGIELPQGDITFDIKLSSQFVPIYVKNASGTTQTQKGTTTDVTQSYTPLVWSYDVQSADMCRDRDTKMTTYAYAFNAAPFNKNSDRDRGYYDGGSWSAVQDGNVIHFTVRDYKFDGVFPYINVGQSSELSTYYNKETGVQNIGCFSAAELYVVQPFTTRSGTQVLNDFSKNGTYAQNIGTGTCDSGSFQMKLETVNLRAATATGQSLRIANDNSNQGSTQDDVLNVSVALQRPGSYQQRHLYSAKSTSGMYDVFGVGESKPGSCATNGNDWATLGTEIGLTFGGYAQTNGDEGNKMCAGKWLLKFNAEAFELLDHDTSDKPRTANLYANLYYSHPFLVAVKPDGTNWSSDAELKSTSMFDLCYYRTISEAKQHGEIVGVMVEAEPLQSVGVDGLPYSIVETYFTQNVKVRSDMSLTNRYFIITEESMIWTMSDYLSAGKSIPSLCGNDPSNPITLPKATYYINQPSAYKNGDGVYNQHHGAYQIGDTILILGYKASILKKLEQTVDGAPKSNYNLDAGQRIIDFVLDPSVSFSEYLQPEQKCVTTVTIEDTLPKYLTYRPGSCYFGGIYTQNSANGGTGGTMTGGVQTEPQVTNHADGTQTLKWVIENVTVGQPMPLIHYSVYAGTAGDPQNDVPKGTTNLINRVQISADGDQRVHSLQYGNVSEVGLVLTRGDASSYGKFSRDALVELDGELEYVIYFDSNSDSIIDDVVLMDTMPRNGYFGSNFSGTYTISGWKMDTSKTSVQNFKLYYTMDEKYAGKTISDIPISEIQTWSIAEISSQGVAQKLIGTMPVAWAMVGKLEAQQGVYVELSVQLESANVPNESNVYRNTFSHNKITTTTEEMTVSRTLEGLTWLDENHDGLQDSGESRVSGIQVSLWKLKDGGNPDKEADYLPFCYIGTNTPMQILSGQQVSAKAASSVESYSTGQYLFTDLPAGTYAVRFDSGTEDIAPLRASPVNRGSVSDDLRDSDATPVYSSDKNTLKYTLITGISLPTAEEMSVVKYESKHHDSGFYKQGYILPNTGASGTVPYTTGGLLLIAAAAILFFSSRKKQKRGHASTC